MAIIIENTKNKIFKMGAYILQKGTSYVVLFVLLGITALIVPNFFKPANLVNIARQAAPLWIVSIGQTFVILGGGIDLSVASLMACTNIILASITGGTSELVLPTILLCLAFGVIIGLLNGIFIVKRGVPPFIMTLAMAIILEGGRLVYTKGSAYGYISSYIIFLSRGKIGIFPLSIIIPLIVAIISYVILRKTIFGRALYCSGANEKTAYVSGVKTDFIKITSYIICSLLAAVSGIILSGYLGVADNWAAPGYDLDSIAAVVVGGTTFEGGIGGVGGTTVGALLIVIITNLMLFFGFGIETQLIGKATIVILAVSIYTHIKK